MTSIIFASTIDASWGDAAGLVFASEIGFDTEGWAEGARDSDITSGAAEALSNRDATDIEEIVAAFKLALKEGQGWKLEASRILDILDPGWY